MTPESFLLVADPLPEPMLLATRAGMVVAANRAAVRLGGGELVSRPLEEFLAEAPEEVAHYLRLCARTTSLVLGALTLRGEEGDVPCRVEGCLLAPAEAPHHAYVMLRLTRKESAIGRFVALNQRNAELGSEILRRRQAEQEAREQSERLRVTLHSIGDAVIVTDPLGNVVAMNPVAESMTGWRGEEATGQPLTEVFVIVNEDTRLPVENPALRALAEGVIVGVANHTVLLGKDGVERPIDDSAAPIRDRAGRVIGAVLVFRDISGRREADVRLRASEQRFRTLAETIPQLAWTARADGHIDWFNRRWYEYTGTTPEEMEGWGWQRVHDPAALPDVLARWKRSIATGEPFDMTFPLRGADGVFRPFLTRVQPLLDRAGRVVQWFGTNTDISAQRAMEKALREEDRRKDEFIATLAHELRNPLAPIRHGIEIIRLAAGDPALVEQARVVMERQMAHLVRLVDDLLDLNRISRGKIDLRKERLALQDVVASAVEAISPLIQPSQHLLEVSAPERRLCVDGDGTRLTQVVTNLLSNAVKYSQRGSVVEICVAARNGVGEVLVRDHGIGIPQHMLTRIFDLFQQGERSTEGARGGLGIGLTIARRLVEMHGGTVEARSEGVDRGSEFVVRLPLAAEAEHTEAARAAPVPRPAERRRILVADDNHDAAKSLALMLEILGHEVRVAHDGLEALELAGGYRPEVVILDIGMPHLDGYETCERIRLEPWGKEALLVAATGWGKTSDLARSSAAGFDAHLVKPVEPEALEQLLVRRPRQTRAPAADPAPEP